jgi:1-aminocyclopropane-1-carboxylate deaminase
MVQAEFTTGPNPLVIQTINDPLLLRRQIDLRVARLDLLHPVLGGNKWFKLIPNLQLARATGARTLLSFGGAYSNHIHALAAAGALSGFQTIGIIRGEIPEPLNPTLAFARGQGMTLVPVSRSEYRLRHNPGYLADLLKRFGSDVFPIPEGGANLSGVRGCREIANVLSGVIPDLHESELVLACGTGTTLAGLVAGLQSLQSGRNPVATVGQVRGFAVLKGADFLRDDVKAWLQRLDVDPDSGWSLETDYHCGGYARCPPHLESFIDSFRERHGIPLDPVYTGKLAWAVYTRIEQGGWAPGSRIILLHTGGMQGRP